MQPPYGCHLLSSNLLLDLSERRQQSLAFIEPYSI